MTVQDASTRPLPPVRLDRREIAGSFGDLGTLLPLAVLLITANRLNPTVLFGVVGLAYLLSGLYYRIPMAVQPLKSFSALAIAHTLGPSVIAAGAMLMGLCLLILGVSGAATWISRRFPKALIRGIQLGVGLILIRVGLRLCVEPVGGSAMWLPAALTVGSLATILFFARSKALPAGLLVVGGGVLVGFTLTGLPPVTPGPEIARVGGVSASDFWTAAILLVLPQIPLTLINSLPATQDVARKWYGPDSRRVTARALSIGMGIVNVAAGLVGGMPICHGSSGVTAHHRFGARTGGAGVFLGAVLLILALGFGPSLTGLCNVIPRPVLGAMLVYVGVAHCLLIRDIAGWWSWAVVLAAGGIGGVMNHNGYGLAAGLAVLGVRWVGQRWLLRDKGTACLDIGRRREVLDPVRGSLASAAAAREHT